jgi:hypothetical protein
MINIVNHTIFLDDENFNSYNRHYVKWNPRLIIKIIGIYKDLLGEIIS